MADKLLSLEERRVPEKRNIPLRKRSRGTSAQQIADEDGTLHPKMSTVHCKTLNERRCFVSPRRVLTVSVLVGLIWGMLGCQTYQPKEKVHVDKVPFTHQLRLKHNLTPEEIKHLQFYVSNTITLHRIVTADDKQILRGKLILSSGKTVEEVLVKKGTPGVAVDVKDDAIDVSFEEGTYLTFARDTELFPEKYRLAVTKSDSGPPTVQFDGRTYTVMHKSEQAYLLISMEALTDIVNKRRVLPGRTIREE